MATSSIFHNIVIDSEKELIELLNALEEAERLANASDNKEEIINNVKTLTKDEIKALLKKD
ncbi:hypothetical protein [Megamonas hypermegale]|uniref:hypothetical protein n=1 Tax=Megamonas hypermegale TaxID=158847 RepID=UPI0019589107|nr:hypothetical protein [Megamonas hypermegale]MBM6761667.1 hypothetical protein [Megamonas hypermegale]